MTELGGKGGEFLCRTICYRNNTLEGRGKRDRVDVACLFNYHPSVIMNVQQSLTADPVSSIKNSTVSSMRCGMFDERKVAQAAAFLVNKRGGRMSVLKLMKLLYLADREAIRRFGLPISGDKYASLPHGPILSATYSLITGEANSAENGWEFWISDRENHEVALERDASRDSLTDLSNAEIAVLDAVWAQFGHMTRWEIRDYTHDKTHVPEWDDPNGSAKPLHLRSIMQAVGKSKDEIEHDLARVEAQQKVSAIFASL